MQTVIIGADHNGYKHKAFLIEKLGETGYKVVDVGPTELDPSDDYPDFAIPLAQKVARGKGVGIFICSSGIGPSMAANKVKGIRAGVARTIEDARLIRSHQDANILCLGAASTDPQAAFDISLAFLKTPFEGGRHLRRVEKIMKLENR